jgi:hypothetical protein
MQYLDSWKYMPGVAAASNKTVPLGLIVVVIIDCRIQSHSDIPVI